MENYGIRSIGRFLTTYDCSTGKCTNSPKDKDYRFQDGDFFRVTQSDTSKDIFYKPFGGYFSTLTACKTDKRYDLYRYNGVNWYGYNLTAGTVSDFIDKPKVLKESKCKNCGAPVKMSYYSSLITCEYCQSRYFMG